MLTHPLLCTDLLIPNLPCFLTSERPSLSLSALVLSNTSFYSSQFRFTGLRCTRLCSYSKDFFTFFFFKWLKKSRHQKTAYGSFLFFVKEERKESPCRYCSSSSSKNNDKDTHVSSPGQQTTDTHTHTHTHNTERHIHTHTYTQEDKRR